MMDRKGITVYLAVNFVALLAACVALHFSGAASADSTLYGTGAFYALMWLPAVSGLAASLASRDTGVRKPALWPVPLIGAAALTVAVAILFVALYTATTLAGWTQPDWKLSALMEEMGSQAQGASPLPFIVLGFLFTLGLGPTLYALLSVGSEWGWRGYLQPRLMPLGHARASLLGGLLWALWLLPLNAVLSGGDTLAAWTHAGAMSAMWFAFGVALNELWARTRHVGLTAVCCGCVLGHTSGMWTYLFPSTESYLAGPFGVIATAAWAVIALILLVLPCKPEPVEQAAAEPEEA
ncbi:MAG: protease family protein [Candidatus Hydrogenedentes bacterium]|nr:protease family protein [Candidatus Hydrogenedentota bacterium]